MPSRVADADPDDIARRYAKSRERRERRQRSRDATPSPKSSSAFDGFRSFFKLSPRNTSEAVADVERTVDTSSRSMADARESPRRERSERTGRREGSAGVGRAPRAREDGDERRPLLRGSARGEGDDDDDLFAPERAASGRRVGWGGAKLTRESLQMLGGDVESGTESATRARALRASVENSGLSRRVMLLPKAWRQWAAMASVSMACSCAGLAIGFPFAARRTLACGPAGACDDGAGREEFGTLNSTLFVGAVLGALIAGRACDLFGRRTTVVGATIPAVAGWIVVFYAKAFSVLSLAGKFTVGISVGMLSAAAPVLLGEAGSGQNRGALAVLPMVAVAKGVLFMYIASLARVVMHWRHFAALCAGMNTLAFVVTALATVESPRWYLSREMPVHAVDALTTLNGAWEEIEVMEEMAKVISRENAKTSPPGAFAQFRFWHLVTLDNLMRCVTMTCTLVGVQQLSGLSYAVYDDPEIPDDAAVPSSEETRVAFIVALMIGVMMCSRFVDHYGRKPCMTASLIGMLISNVSIAAIASGMHFGPARDALDVSVVCYAFFFGLGMSGIPALMSVELFPQHTRATACAFLCALHWLYAFAVTFAYEIALEVFGSAAVHGFFAVVCALGAFYVARFVPETSSKTLEDTVALLTPRSDATRARTRPISSHARAKPPRNVRSVLLV